MALPVDSFSLLIDDISSTYSHLTHFDIKEFTWKDWLALLGAIYAAGKLLKVTGSVYEAVKQYGFTKLKSRPCLKIKYGPWAGGCK